MSQSAPESVSKLLADIVVDFPDLLGNDLVGIYLYGSLTQNAFDAERSDIDCIVITKSELIEEQFKRLESWFERSMYQNPWTARLQMEFLIRDEVLVMDSKASLYQFGRLRRGGSDGNPIIWTNILESGIVLYGPPASTFVPEITLDLVRAALCREVEYLRQEIENPEGEWRKMPKYRIYAVMTLCRTIYTHANSNVVSKPVAAAWAVDCLPPDLRDLVTEAMMPEGEAAAVTVERLQRFIDFTSRELEGTPRSWIR